MDTNFKTLIVVMIVFITTIYSTCHKPLLGCESSYSFLLNAKVYPDKDTISVGDSIWVEINSPDTFIDLISNRQVKFDNAENLGTDMGFVKLINSNPIQLGDAVNDFQFALFNGQEIGSTMPQRIKNYLISYSSGTYKFKLAIIPKQIGIYRFNLGNAANVYKKGESCPKANFNMQLIQTNQHYYLYPGSNGTTSGGTDYFFYVK
jgi:hypothetical protein